MKKQEFRVGIKKGYELWSEVYDTEKNPLIEMEEKPLLAMIGNVKGRLILDAGCGTGRISLKLLKKGAIVKGIDISNKMLAKAKEKCKKYKGISEFKLASIYKIPYRKNMFDMVICSLIISHLRNLNRAIKEMARVLRSGGLMIISDLHPYTILLRDVYTGFYLNGKHYILKNYGHTFENFIKCFKEANLKLVDIKEPKITKRVVDIIRELNKKHGIKIAKKKEKGWKGKPAVLIMKLQKLAKSSTLF
jgi:ubiquinone/menaquinone biosynthesis C-methylase UbiE